MEDDPLEAVDGRLRDGSRIFKRMTVLEHVLLGQYSHQRAGLWGAITRPARVMEEEERSRAKGLKILSFFEERLLPRTHDFAETLSYANRRRLEIARALVSEPKLLLLDEPTAGMNPNDSAGIARLIKKTGRAGDHGFSHRA